MNGGGKGGRVAITGMGLVTCVGADVVTSAASVRAGITRAVPLPFEEFDDQQNEPRPVVGYPLAGIADGYVGVGLYARIASVALQDLFARTGLSPGDPHLWQRSRLYLALSPFRSDTIGQFSQVMAGGLGPALQRRWDWRLPNDPFVPVVSGHTACLLACQQAFDALIEGQIDRAVVVAADSLVGEEELDFFFARGRLKTVDRPSGLMPGEAGAALLLEGRAAAQARGAAGQAWLGRPAYAAAAAGQDLDAALPDIQPWSQNLLAAVRAVTGSDAGPLTIYTDVNGEDWRASVWGTVMAGLTGQVDWATSRIVHPAVVLGDTGAASGGVGLCLAARAFARSYAAPHPTVPRGGSFATVVASTAERGDAAAVALHPF